MIINHLKENVKVQIGPKTLKETDERKSSVYRTCLYIVSHEEHIHLTSDG